MKKVNKLISRADLAKICGGISSTLIACEKSGRQARLMELDPKYVDVIIRRWQDYTGNQAVRQADDIVFDEVSSAVSTCLR